MIMLKDIYYTYTTACGIMQDLRKLEKYNAAVLAFSNIMHVNIIFK